MSARVTNGRTAGLGRPVQAGGKVRDPNGRRMPLTWRRLPWWAELATIAIFYLLYEAVRAVTPSDLVAADHHAAQIITAERWSHIDIELSLNHFLSSVPTLASVAGFYYTTLHFIVTPLMLVYLWRWRPRQYAELRSAVVLSSVIALIVFWVWPVTPPRFALAGTSDTILHIHMLGMSDPHGVVSLINQYAAMPSLHVGWAVWCAFAVVSTNRSPWRHLAWLYPLMTSFVVISTANHYVLDVVGGALLTAVCLIVARRDRAREQRRADTADFSSLLAPSLQPDLQPAS
jgi:hypothetical protein